MFSQRLSVYSALVLASVFYSSAGYSLELVDTTKTLDKQPAFASIKNATSSPVSLTFSNGVSVEIPKISGKLIPCADIEGLVMFVDPQAEVAQPSHKILCGHSYTVKENAL